MKAPKAPPLPEFRFSTVYSDSMVLQRSPHAASLWGYGTPGNAVNISVVTAAANQEIICSSSGVTDASGQWRISLPPQQASTSPMIILASSGSSKIELKDVLFGDVWLCSGQSNMAFDLATPINDPAAEAKIAKAYGTDPGASMDGIYINTSTAIQSADTVPNLRFVVVGNKPHKTPAPSRRASLI